ncbi:MAG: 1-phosphofructokinase [Sporolactobacillus sp.]|jgi:tagatose 6-phosphate kinase|nr:1-phosphofructokinase [Sporolactobacillus sp.]
MILTLTLNPAIDMNYQLDRLNINTVNRCDHVIKTAGGKGLNVTRVLKCAGADVCATGFLGGKTGEFIKQQLDVGSIHHRFVPIKGNTRHCLAIMHEGNQTEILEGGPTISPQEAQAFLDTYDRLLERATVVTASGSLPKGLSNVFYRQLIEKAAAKGKKFLLDTSGETLKSAIEARPYLIKPNWHELEAVVGTKLTTLADILAEVIKLSALHVPFVVVSLGKDGAIGCADGRAFMARPPEVRAVNPVGSGDSMIAGLAYGLEKGLTPEDSLVYGVAFGTLNAMAEKTGWIDARKIEAIVRQVTVNSVMHA